MDSIGFYMPGWLYRSNKSDRMFADELVNTLKKSKRYAPLRLNLSSLKLASEKDAVKFCERNQLALVVQHDSPFYGADERYKNNVNLLESVVPFVNSTEAQKIGYDKMATKRVLREKGLPVLEGKIIICLEDIHAHMVEHEMYVIKPPDQGAGTGVKLIKRKGADFFAHYDGGWQKVNIMSHMNNIVLKQEFRWNWPLLMLKNKLREFRYRSMMIEPYFNNHEEGFSSLRCTVIGTEVVEAVKRTNYKNITSNVSSGGTAQRTELTPYQKEIAIAATSAIGADYAGVDILTRGSANVIGEINIGPFTVFGKWTGVNVGNIFGEYLIKKCDELLGQSKPM